MPPLVLLWLGAIIVFAILEAATAALVSIWFVAGSVGGLILALCGAGFWVQFLVFLIISALVLAVVRPIAKKYLTPKKVSTNYDRCIGTTAVVTETIDNLQSTGAIKVSGVQWTARSTTGQVIPAGELAKIISIEGVKLLVEPVSNNEGE